MKKLLIIIVLALAIPLYGQDTTHIKSNDSFLYAELKGFVRPFSDKVNVTIDFGQNTTFFEDKRLRDESGKVITFNSMVDAMNWMGEQGWEFVQAYVVSSKDENTFHWVLKLNLIKLSPDQLEKVRGKFITKKNTGR